MRIAIMFDRFGPYHIARLEEAAKYVHVIPIEIFSETSDYQWDKVGSDRLKNRITLFPNKGSDQISKEQLSAVLTNCLNKEMPEAVAVNGWFDLSALIALQWCLKKNIPSVVMAESAAGDFKRVWWREFMKSRIVRQFSAALVGGIRHADYLAQLGMHRANIYFGYDVVDNNHFEYLSRRARENEKQYRAEKRLPENYFLVVSRFIEKKNIPFIISTYYQYYNRTPETAWDLLILGDGPLKLQYVQLVKDLNIENRVIFKGFKQYSDLPIYFGLAKAFIHASTSEQWGLVVNEAMASGLPVVISESCGCVPELVHDGRNGFIFDPLNENSLKVIMLRLSHDQALIKRMSSESVKIISDFDKDAFGKGLFNACTTALQRERKKPGVVAKQLLKLMVKR